MIEACLLTHHSQHAAHAWRELRLLEVQFNVGGELAIMTVRAQVIRARHFYLAEHAQERLGAHLPVNGPLAARTRKNALVRSGRRELQ